MANKIMVLDRRDGNFKLGTIDSMGRAIFDDPQAEAVPAHVASIRGAMRRHRARRYANAAIASQRRKAERREYQPLKWRANWNGGAPIAVLASNPPSGCVIFDNFEDALAAGKRLAASMHNAR